MLWAELSRGEKPGDTQNRALKDKTFKNTLRYIYRSQWSSLGETTAESRRHNDSGEGGCFCHPQKNPRCEDSETDEMQKKKHKTDNTLGDQGRPEFRRTRFPAVPTNQLFSARTWGLSAPPPPPRQPGKTSSVCMQNTDGSSSRFKWCEPHSG